MADRLRPRGQQGEQLVTIRLRRLDEAPPPGGEAAPQPPGESGDAQGTGVAPALSNLGGDSGAAQSAPTGATGAPSAGESRTGARRRLVRQTLAGPHSGMRYGSPDSSMGPSRQGSVLGLSALVARYRALIKRLIRYASVSVVSTATSLTILGILVGLVNAPAGWANAIATTIATIPSFELNRRWVWCYEGQRLVFRQVLPFFALSLAGLALSTFNVHYVGLWTTQAGWGRLERTGAVGFTNVGTFGVLWVFQYVLCDRVLFRSRSAAVHEDEEDEEAEEAGGAPAAAGEWDVGNLIDLAPHD
jgi:putative flippase GtrA